MLYRKIKKKIEYELENGNKAILVTGARQTGKTFLIRQILKEKKNNYVEINLLESPQLIPAFNFALSHDVNIFYEQLQIISGKKLNTDTVIFIDEVQECKEIVTAIKFLVDKGKYRYILSGSLLGVELVNLRSAPIGYLQTIEMYPLDFEEFLLANNVDEDVILSLKKNYIEKTPIPDLKHKLLLNLFYKYLIVGGMPQVINEYLETNDLNAVDEVQRSIIQLYKKDFTKYEKSQKLKLITIYDNIPAELDSKNKRFIFADIDKNIKFERYENSFVWLSDAGVALPTFNVTEAQIPLMASKKSNIFKLFLSDVGLLTCLYGKNSKLQILSQANEINYGAIFENYVAQELKVHGFNLYYYNNKKHGEIDFLIEQDASVLPIEVKSGKDYTVHSALSYFMSNGTFKKGMVLSSYNISTKDNITYYPIYMTMFLDNKIEKAEIGKIDIDLLNSLG